MATSLATKRKSFVFKESTKFEPVKRDEIHGADNLLTIFDSLIEQLRNFDELDKSNDAMTNGVCLHGPPGTGKTFFSRYLATESKACFVDMRNFPRPKVWGRNSSIAPEDITEQFRLARLYIQRHRRPVILFYDEMPDDEDKVDSSIIEQLRIEMDGIAGKTNGIMLLITTTASDPDDIDGALFRAGRVELHIPFTPPTPKGREAILRYYLSKKKCEKDIDVESINALLAADTTPADIAQYVSEASTVARKGKVPLAERHVVQAIIPHLTGFFTDDILTDEEMRKVEIHEAGHACVGRALGIAVLVVTVYRSVDKSADSYGQAIATFPDDKQMTIYDLERQLMISYGGMAAERLCGIPPNAGMSGDLGNINECARIMVDKLAQGKRLRAAYGTFQFSKNDLNSEPVMRLRDKDIAAIMKEAEQKTMRIVRKERKKILAVAKRLREKKIILRRELEKLAG